MKLNLVKINATDFSKYKSGKSKLISLYLRCERSTFFFFFLVVCHEIPDEIHTYKNNAANKSPQSVFSTAENGETEGQHPEMDQRDHHVCHVITGADEAILKSNTVRDLSEISRGGGGRGVGILNLGSESR